MPLGGTDAIGWVETSPPDTEAAGLGNDRIQSLRTSLRQALASEHNWPSSSGDDFGYHILGSARAHVGTQSRVSSGDTDGRLMFASDTSRLFGVGSTGTVYLGGPTVVSVGTHAGTVPQRHIWVEEFGFGVTSSSGSTVLTFPSAYSGSPYVWATQRITSASSTPAIFSITSRDNAGVSCFVRAMNDSGSTLSGAEFIWRSIGSRVL